jgi:hypothetical protein
MWRIVGGLVVLDISNVLSDSDKWKIETLWPFYGLINDTTWKTDI